MKGDNREGGWISNTPIRVLHDTGLVGFAALMGFLVSIGMTTRKALRVANHRNKAVIVALCAGLVLYVITFQATEATLLAFTWIHLGLLACTGSTMRSREGVLLTSVVN